MRRRLEAFVPIVLLAILVQLVAPIAAFRVVASAASDPLYMATICSGMTSSEDAQTAPSPSVPARTSHAQIDCCVFCATGHGGAAAVDPPQPVFASLQRQYQLISWLESSDRTPTIRAGSNAQARAPPQLT